MDNPSFFLEGVVQEKGGQQDFEGPLSLILMLLAKNKIEIRDIKIADILDQYLEYLAGMQSMDLEIASEFVQMAAQLLYIKTKMLLTSGEEEVSELEALMQSLEQLKCRDVYESIKQVTPELREAAEHGLLYYTKLPEPLPKSAREYEYRHEPVDLLKALRGMYARGAKPEAPDISSAVPQKIVYSIKDKSVELLTRLRGGRASLRELYMLCRSKSEIVATFVAVLELSSLGSVVISRADGDYGVEFAGGSIEEIINKIIE